MAERPCTHGPPTTTAKPATILGQAAPCYGPPCYGPAVQEHAWVGWGGGGGGGIQSKSPALPPQTFPAYSVPHTSLICLLIHNRKEAISHSFSADTNPAHTCLTAASDTHSVRPGKYLGFSWVHLQMGSWTIHSLVQQTLLHTHSVQAPVGTAVVCWSWLVTDLGVLIFDFQGFCKLNTAIIKLK